MNQNNPYPLRLEASLKQKLIQLAQQNSRSFNKEIEFILKNYMEQYETENGKIKIPRQKLANNQPEQTE